VGPSKRAWSQIFISESGSDDDKVWVVTETVEVGTQAGNQVGEECQEVVVVLRAHNTSIQLQVDAQEWMGHQVEHLVPPASSATPDFTPSIPTSSYTFA